MSFDIHAISTQFCKSEFAISSHADGEMQSDDISYDLLVEAIGRDKPKIIEEYKYSCLILGWGISDEPLHAVIALGTVNQEHDTPVLVTVYRPDKDSRKRWKEDYETRK